MNDSTKEDINPTRELVEVRLVAMLLGEASPFEEEQLREQLKQDVDLAKFCAIVLPVMVMQSPCSNPARSSVFIIG